LRKVKISRGLKTHVYTRLGLRKQLKIYVEFVGIVNKQLKGALE
jgi:hypothetical protein